MCLPSLSPGRVGVIEHEQISNRKAILHHDSHTPPNTTVDKRVLRCRHNRCNIYIPCLLVDTCTGLRAAGGGKRWVLTLGSNQKLHHSQRPCIRCLLHDLEVFVLKCSCVEYT